jgi:hypothetical protein
MFGSQVLETAIGLAVMLFIVATAASAIAETVSRLLGKRAKGLEEGIVALLHGEHKKGAELADAAKTFKKTSVWKAADAAAGMRRGPSYMSVTMFADMATELLQPPISKDKTDWPSNLKNRLEAMVAEGRRDIVELKSGLEVWFDEAMARIEGAYKRWVTKVLFVVGLVIAVAGNVSTITTAQQLWQDPVTRATVSAAAGKLLEDGATPDELAAVADTADKMQQVGLPVGWNAESRGAWTDWTTGELYWRKAADVGGWLLTAVLVMLGAPFWFDLLTRLVALRVAGPKPSTAAQDETSATRALAAANQAPPTSSTLGQDQGAFARSMGLVP